MLKPCEGCGNVFDDGGFASKMYCTVRCRTTSKRRRAVVRDHNRFIVQKPETIANERGVVLLTNPTGDALTLEAEKYVKEPTRQPLMIKGSLPTWAIPEEILLGPTGLTRADEVPTKWLMCHKKFME